MTIKCKKIIHRGYLEWENAKDRGIYLQQYFGKWQYLYSSKKGLISCVFLTDPFEKNGYWEIFCLEGNLFEDVERFATKKQAREKALEYLQEVKE